MATATLSHTHHLPQTATGPAQDPTSTMDSAASGTLSTLDTLATNIGTSARHLLDHLFPPEQRQSVLATLKAFVLANPKLSAFLGMNVALTGIPLGLFILFSLSVAVFSILGGIIIGLIGAGLVTLTCVGLALAVVFPILMFTTASACFLFLFGLGGYKILKWASGNDSVEGQSNGEKGCITVGDGLNSITGGRLTGFLNGAKAEQDKTDIKGFSDERNPPRPPQTPEKLKHVSVDHVATPQPVGEVQNQHPTSATSTAAVPRTAKAPVTLPLSQKKRTDDSNVDAVADGG